MSIVVTTPTGNIGSVVVRQLVDAGANVAVITRNPDRLDPAIRNKVSVHQGDLFDADFVVQATEGAKALFWLNPPDYAVQDWRAQFVESARIGSHAVRKNRIPHVVLLSSAGAHHETGFGPVSWIQIIEKALAETGANVLHLRPGYFFENFLAQVESIKNAGAIFMPVPPEISYPMIATRDIGVVAAKRLLAQDFSGVSVLGLHGPAEQLTFGEAATVIGDVVGKPVQHVQVPMEAFAEQFAATGASPSVVAGYAELLGAFARGENIAEARTPETTTPTTLREWATQTLKPLVGG